MVYKHKKRRLTVLIIKKRQKPKGDLGWEIGQMLFKGTNLQRLVNISRD